MQDFTALNLGTDHWAMLEFGGMSTVTETRGASFREVMRYDDMGDAATAYLSIVSRMFGGALRRDEMSAAQDAITYHLDALGVDHDWTGASEAEINSGDSQCLCIYEDEEDED